MTKNVALYSLCRGLLTKSTDPQKGSTRSIYKPLARARGALWCVLLLLCLGVESVQAQYYDWGRSPHDIKWMKAEASSGKVLYPSYYQERAMQNIALIDSLYPYLSYGLSHEPLKLPIIMHTQNMVSNGLVLWAPKRMELEVAPAINSIALPWNLQLLSHELRHTAQYGSAYQHFFKPLGWLIGQNAGLINLAMLPTWFLEGDAVMMETQFAPYGRALQPNFTIEMRAYLSEGIPNARNLDNIDRWFCGSYRTVMPDHYQLGFQLTAWSRKAYGEDVWDRIIDYTARYPYTILTTKFALHKYFDSSVTKIYHGTFKELKSLWDSLPQQPNSTEILPTPTKSYTTYEAPMPLNDSTLFVFKEDMDRYNRLVLVDPRTAKERSLKTTGYVSSPPTLLDSTIYWSEFRTGTIWEQRVLSKVHSYDLRTGRKQHLRQFNNDFLPTPLGDGRIATLRYDPSGHFLLGVSGGEWHPLPDSISVHGMAYDTTTGTLAIIALTRQGMGIYSADLESGALTPLSAPTYSTIHNLRAGEGYLSFNSIRSGLDEVHLFDLRSREELQLTHSRYGSISPSAPNGSDTLYMTTYTPKGYLLSRQAYHLDSLERVAYSALPENRVNPTYKSWNLPDITQIALPTTDSTPEQVHQKRYRQGLNLLNPHSWLPLNIDPYEIVDELNFDAMFGATLMSQNLLSNSSGYISYGYSPNYVDQIRGAFTYGGLPVYLEANFTYGGGNQSLYGAPSSESPASSEVESPSRKPYSSVGVVASLPLQLSSGAHFRKLTPRVELSRTNALIYNQSTSSYDQGLNIFAYSLTYSDQLRMAERNFLPRWGYGAFFSSMSASKEKGFSTLYALKGWLYTPGVAPNHSLLLQGAVQSQALASSGFVYKSLSPRGANYYFASQRYAAYSVDYELPLLYPDWGFWGVLYINRIRLKGYYDFARYESFGLNSAGTSDYNNLTSYGGEITFDTRVLRIPNKDTSLGIHLYKPSDRAGVVVGCSISMPL